MLVDLFEFQNKALGSLRERQVKAQRRYKQDGEKSIIPLQPLRVLARPSSCLHSLRLSILETPIKGLRMMPSCYG